MSLLRTEQYERLMAMIEPNQQTWDLPPNDVKAIRWAVTALKWQEEVYELMHAKVDQLAMNFKNMKGKQ